MAVKTDGETDRNTPEARNRAREYWDRFVESMGHSPDSQADFSAFLSNNERSEHGESVIDHTPAAILSYLRTGDSIQVGYDMTGDELGIALIVFMTTLHDHDADLVHEISRTIRKDLDMGPCDDPTADHMKYIVRGAVATLLMPLL